VKKSVAVRVLCLVVASLVLGGAVAYAAVTGSPYETLKKAALDALTFRNATTEGWGKMYVNGNLQMAEKIYIVESNSAYLEYNYDDSGDYRGFRYSAGDLSIHDISMYDGTHWYTGYIDPGGYQYWRGSGMAIFSSEDRESAYMRFIEILADVLIGDLKNNITMSSSGGVRYVHGTLTENQVPEIVKAGLDMIVEQSSSYGFNYDTRDELTREDFDGYDPLEIPMKSFTINYVNVEAEIDADGNLLKIDVDGKATTTDIFDKINEIEVDFSMRFSDIGTSDPVCPIPGVEQLLTAEYIQEHFGSGYMSFYFTLNADGSINEDSITTTYPGELGAYNRRAMYSSAMPYSYDMYSVPGQIETVYDTIYFED
jgi:hypothetical protein